MQYRDDTCTWDDMKDHFTIERHALRINVPQLSNGEIDCYQEEKGRRYPRLDYSKGFPDWWWMQSTNIMVPSQHSQEGVHYAAEVHLTHFYEVDHYKNKVRVYQVVLLAHRAKHGFLTLLPAYVFEITARPPGNFLTRLRRCRVLGLPRQINLSVAYRRRKSAGQLQRRACTCIWQMRALPKSRAYHRVARRSKSQR